MATRNERISTEGRGQPRPQESTVSTGGADAPAGAQGMTAPDQERARPVGREGGAQAARRGPVPPLQQPGSPVRFGPSPGLLAGAFMANPYEFMRRMGAEMERVFEDAGLGHGPPGPAGEPMAGGALAGGALVRGRRASDTGVWTPRIETLRRGDELVVRADLPGVKKEDVHVDVEGGVLTLSGERRQRHEERRDGVYRSEQSYGSFFRSIPLPEDVDGERITATLEDGVLEVIVPLPEQKQQRGRRIQIK